MRSQDVEKKWELVHSNSSPLKLNKVVFSNLSGIGKGEFTFSSTINAVCGKNGLGKSTLLKAIYLTLKKSSGDNYLETQSRLEKARFKVDYSSSGTKSELEYGSGKESVPVIYLDPSELCQVSLDTLRTEKNLDEIIDQYDFGALDATSLREVKRILGRNYTSIEFMELEDLGSYALTPYFRVSLNGYSYDSRHMALGELAVLYIWWLLWNLREPHIILIEEPENFLTPQAQRYLIDFLAFISVKQKLWVLLSTHSEHVIENIGLSATSVVVENEIEGSVIVKNPRHKLEFLEHLGLDPKKKGIILVEDTAALKAVEQACLYFGSFLLSDYELVKAGGSGPIKTLLANFPADQSSVECFGIFDGDERAKIKTGSLKNSAFLPGTLSPEREFEKLIRGSPDEFASAMHVAKPTLIEKLSMVIGQDEHDWLENLRKSLNLDYITTVTNLARLWVKKHRQDFFELISNFDGSVQFPVAEPEPEKFFGAIVHLNSEKGYGFIRSDSGTDYFMHFSQISKSNHEKLSLKSRVSFKVKATPKGEAAFSVEMVDTESTSL